MKWLGRLPLGRDVNDPVVTVRFAPYERGDVAAGIVEDDKRSLGEIELHDRFFLVKAAKTEGLFVNEEGLWLGVLVNLVWQTIEDVGAIIALIEVANTFLLARSASF